MTTHIQESVIISYVSIRHRHKVSHHLGWILERLHWVRPGRFHSRGRVGSRHTSRWRERSRWRHTSRRRERSRWRHTSRRRERSRRRHPTGRLSSRWRPPSWGVAGLAEVNQYAIVDQHVAADLKVIRGRDKRHVVRASDLLQVAINQFLRGSVHTQLQHQLLVDVVQHITATARGKLLPVFRGQLICDDAQLGNVSQQSRRRPDHAGDWLLQAFVKLSTTLRNTCMALSHLMHIFPLWSCDIMFNDTVL